MNTQPRMATIATKAPERQEESGRAATIINTKRNWV